MIQIKIDDKTINVDPHLTIGKYMKLQKNPKKYEDHSELLALYLDLTVQELKGVPYDQIKFVESILTPTMLETEYDIVLTFEHEGVTYGFENDWGNLKWGQWVDMEVFSQPDKINDSIHILMSLLYRPIEIDNGKKYRLQKYDSDEVLRRAEVFLNLPVTYWWGAAGFFFDISQAFIINTKNSLELTMWTEKMLKPLRKILPSFLLPNPPRDIISNLLSNSVKKTSRSSNNSTR